MAYEVACQSRPCLWSLAALVWLAATFKGLFILASYKASPGSVGTASRSWPAGGRFSLHRQLPTLVMVIHPGCPCTDASLEELDRLMARLGGRVAAHVLVYQSATERWAGSAQRRKAATIPGVMVWDDPDGERTKRLGAQTSGHTLLYAAGGRLLFSGGITSARGHRGDSAGQAAIVALVLGREIISSSTPVFGCSILSRHAS